jgi:hypothetical protein
MQSRREGGMQQGNAMSFELLHISPPLGQHALWMDITEKLGGCSRGNENLINAFLSLLAAASKEERQESD